MIKSPTLKTHFKTLASHHEKMRFWKLYFDEFQEASKRFKTLKTFKTFKRNKAAGLDKLTGNIITHGYDSLKIPYSMLSRSPFNKTYFFDSLKVAKVTFIFKFLVRSKVLVRIICNRNYYHLNSKGFLYGK